METKFKLDNLLKRLETTKSFIDDSRPIELLHLTSEVTFSFFLKPINKRFLLYIFVLQDFQTITWFKSDKL